MCMSVCLHVSVVPYVCLIPVEAIRCWVPWWLGTAIWELSPGCAKPCPYPNFFPPFFLSVDAFTVPRASTNKVVCIVEYATINTL